MIRRGIAVLVVEDEALVSMMIEDFLGDLGCKVVATAARLDDAVQKAATIDIDVAILDINLAGKLSYPVAAALGARKIPFLFATGYGVAGLPQDWKGIPVLSKPFNLQQLQDALTSALADCGTA